ncbi:MAG: tRNA (adenosine(37)-N6)-dimethylallyltransferase MiaA, partial [Oscillospiraceae bacterium]|nr:tRNA (adenosine(37)-N6)-dimethylallyltransferase MiaA [Oscillospiraceae bacterium]
MDKHKILVICGPTASGKTNLSVEMAKRSNGEIISADSMQIYKGLSIGTAKVTIDEMQSIPHHLIDFLSPQELFSVADFVQYAGACIEKIADKGKTPIIAGGTGLYISSLINGIQFTKDDTDYALREQLQKQAAELGAQEMHRQLETVDP